MNHLRSCAIILTLFAFNPFVHAERSDNFGDEVISDYKNFYSGRNLLNLGVVFAGGAVLAHSDVDKEFRNFYQDDIRSNATDDLASMAKLFGEKQLMLPLIGLAYSLPYFTGIKHESSYAKWTSNTIRGYILGMPIILAMQKVTGASRPSDNMPHHSDWKPFKDKNGVSGHAFGGAVPFLSAAIMYDQGSWQRNSLIFASTLTSWSRVNDDEHYLSQVILGWYLAYKSTISISKTNSSFDKQDEITYLPYIDGDALGVQLAFVF
jgi:hypothetical protein